MCYKILYFGFTQSKSDHCLFVKNSPKAFTALLVNVDDVLIAGTSEEEITDVKKYLDKVFTIKDLGHVRYFLGLEIAQGADGMCVN